MTLRFQISLPGFGSAANPPNPHLRGVGHKREQGRTAASTEPRATGWAALALSSAALSALAPSVAAAQDRQEVLYGRHQTYQSPQHFAFELRFSPFKPDIDSDPALGGKTPFADTFGSPERLLFAAEFDWQVARIPHFGTIGPGVSAGYLSMTRPAQFAPPHAPGASGEDTTLQIFPLYLVGVLRADVLWRELHVPLVPYAKLGLGLSFWRASNTLGTSHSQGVSGVGQSIGTQLAVGLGLNLNVFDQYAARNLDESTGVNNTYLYAEWTRSDLNGLWFQTDPLRVGATYWTFGLAFEF